MAEGAFSLNAETRIRVAEDSPEAREVAEYLAVLLREATGFEMPVEAGATTSTLNAICFELGGKAWVERGDSQGGLENYELEVTSEGVTLLAPAPAGFFYACQTLRQLLPAPTEGASPEGETEWRIPCLRIEDRPQFAWRGSHLDCSRHFFDVDFIKRHLDVMALLKLNTFHWHLTDDQGWRLEIPAYPELTRVAAWRTETDGSRYGGFYTVADVREVVAHAAARHIRIVPEIEMPGHAQAALAAYPYLSCTGGPFEVGAKWGIYQDVFCAANPETFQFLETVLEEVMDLFPGEYIHIGGDEVPKLRWLECPKCQAVMEREGLRDGQALQRWFMDRITRFVIERGRRPIAWGDEVLKEGEPPEGLTIMVWSGNGHSNARKAARMGHDVILCPRSHAYFDLPYALTSTKKTYGLRALPRAMGPGAAQRILGVQGCLWTEFVPDESTAEQRMHPRLAALAEVGWTMKGKRDWGDFERRLDIYLERLRAIGVEFWE